jgi:hypothetical protein
VLSKGGKGRVSNVGVCNLGRRDFVFFLIQQHHRGCGKEKLGLKRKKELDITFFGGIHLKYMPLNRGQLTTRHI